MSNRLIQILDRTGDKKSATLPTMEDVRAAEPQLSVDDVRTRLNGKTGRAYWRSLEELSGDPGFERLMEREFPQQAPRDMAPLQRRDFLKLMGASLALAGATGCAFQPQEHIVSQVKASPDWTPSIPQFYATATTMGGFALGLLAESNAGRPTKLEGNPDHPSSLGATDIFAQAEVLRLWDPERAQQIRKLNANATWEDFIGAMDSALRELQKDGGRGFHLLTETITSPSLANQIANLQRAMPQMTWHQYEPVTRDGARLGAQQSFGTPTHVTYRFDRADRVLSLDADFLHEEVGHTAYARAFSDRRRARKQMDAAMNRLYCIESTPTITGAMSDNRLAAKASRVRNLSLAMAAALGVAGAAAPKVSDAERKFIDAVAADLKSAPRGRSLVIAGAQQAPEVHVLAHAMNATLGNLNETVVGHAPIEAQPVVNPNGGGQARSIGDLVGAMDGGEVRLLLMMGGNAAFNAPADLKFAQKLKAQVLREETKSPLVAIHVSDYDDETSALCTWHIPACHFLETWGDVRGHDGTVTIQQPLIQPLYPDCKSLNQVLAAFELNPNRSNLEIVSGFWQQKRPSASFDKEWIAWIHNGIVPGTAQAPRPLAFSGTIPGEGGEIQGMEVMLRPDPTIWDGRYANNAWLQELPKPLLKTVWDNAAIMSLNQAQKLGVSDDDVVDVRANNALAQLPVVILPGHPDDSVTVHFGYGRERGGQVANGTGRDVYPLRASNAMSFAKADVQANGSSFRVARTAHHNLIDPDLKTVDGVHDRPLVQMATFAQFEKNANFVHAETQKSLPYIGLVERGKGSVEKETVETGREGGPGEAKEATPHDANPSAGHAGEKNEAHGEKGGAHGKEEQKDFPTLYSKSRDTVLNDEEISYAWGMSVDTSTCIGCNACVIACQSENNYAVTGKDQVMMGRTMHWIRIDTYYHGDVADPDIVFAPVMCMHCEKAPCEPVCPVIATEHSPDGINVMVYNRCIGTRYCSNNCPYKVRRFNYLQYSDQDTPQIQLMHNPDVTVRSRGVMEKCTYCLQRVREGGIQAEKEDRLLRDGEVLTACQQACPTNAIIFGDIRNEKSLVSSLKREPHSYGMLTELNTYPRTTYLGKVHNPNPALRNEKNEQNTETLKPADHEGSEPAEGKTHSG